MISSQDNKNSNDHSRTPSNSRTSIYCYCQVCSKKIMAIQSKCKCSNFYCGKHLHQHDCSFSHFAHHQSVLEKQNRKVESDKLIRL